MNRKVEDGFEETLAWLRSERPPFSEADLAAMRRAVWREIEARRQPEGVLRRERLVLAGAAVLAAALAAALWLRPFAIPPTLPASTVAAASPAPSSANAERPLVEDSREPALTRPVRPRARPRGPSPADVPVRIEFQTANPEVRIIWLVKKGEAAPRPFSPSRHQEVS